MHLSPNRETVVKHLAEPWIAVRNWGAHQSGVGLGANIVIGTIAAKGRHGDPVDFSDQLKRYFFGENLDRGKSDRKGPGRVDSREMKGHNLRGSTTRIQGISIWRCVADCRLLMTNWIVRPRPVSRQACPLCSQPHLISRHCFRQGYAGTWRKWRFRISAAWHACLDVA